MYHTGRRTWAGHEWHMKSVPLLACSLMYLKVHKKFGKNISGGFIRQSTLGSNGREQEVACNSTLLRHSSQYRQEDVPVCSSTRLSENAGSGFSDASSACGDHRRHSRSRHSEVHLKQRHTTVRIRERLHDEDIGRWPAPTDPGPLLSCRANTCLTTNYGSPAKGNDNGRVGRKVWHPDQIYSTRTYVTKCLYRALQQNVRYDWLSHCLFESVDGVQEFATKMALN